MNCEEILDSLASDNFETLDSSEQKESASESSGRKKSRYTREQLLRAAIYGVDELHKECETLLNIHSPFRRQKIKSGLIH